MPYMGKWISKAKDWTPLQNRETVFKGYNKPDLDHKDPWQFKNFLLTEDAG
jgi:homospermidine synthase